MSKGETAKIKLVTSTPEVRYRRVAKGVTEYKLVPVDGDYDKKLSEAIAKYPTSDFFETIYQYDEGHKKQFDVSGSVAGFTGLVTDRIVFDFDDKKNPENAQKDAIELLKRLKENEIPSEAIGCFFSGNKGFHVDFKLNKLLTKKEVDPIILGLTHGLATADRRILDEARLFRVPLTINKATGLYKVPLTHDELTTSTIEQIKQFGTAPTRAKHFKVPKILDDLNEKLTALKNTPLEENEVDTTEERRDGEQPDITNMPSFMTKPLGALLQGFFEAGERNDAMMLLATALRKHGVPKDHAYQMLKETLEKRKKRIGADFDKYELYNTNITPVYSKNWRGGTYTFDHELIKKTIERYGFTDEDKSTEKETGLFSIGDITNQFRSFAQDIDKNTIKLGLEALDNDVRITTSTLTCMLAAPGAGKTTTALNILNDFSNRGESSMFFSLDMAAPIVLQRIIQRITGYSSDHIFDIYKNNKQADMAEIEAKYKESYKHVTFCFKAGLTVDLIREKIIQEKLKLGYYPKLVVIDYMENIIPTLPDSVSGKALIGLGLKDIATEFGIAVVLLVQPQKAAGDPSYELNSYQKIKGTSVFAEAASVVITMYRPGYNAKTSEDDHYVSFTVVKNRMGALCRHDYGWNGAAGTISELDDNQVLELDALRKRIERERADNQRDDLW